MAQADSPSSDPTGRATLDVTPRTKLRRHPERGTRDRALLDAILDEALVCHLGVVIDGAPCVLPTAHVRVGGVVYVHGARANRMFAAALGGPVCLTVTLLDGLVLARSWFHHSMNFRSAVVFGTATEVVEQEEKVAALRALVDHMAKGRSDEARAPTEAELRSTLVLRLPLTEASVKIRSGPPVDAAEDLSSDCWAGELPLAVSAGALIRDPLLGTGVEPSVGLTARAHALST